MRIGFILECQRGGSDAEIYPYLAAKFCNKLRINRKDVLTLTNKAILMNEGHISAETLLTEGCEYVVVIWDRLPKRDGTGRCEDDKEKFTKSLDSLGVDKSKIIMCCIKDMLESWMLGDGTAITEYFQAFNPTHRLPVFPEYKSSVDQSKPVEKLKRYNNKYNKSIDNFKIIELIKDFTKIAARNDSFKFFKESIEAICRN